MSASFSFFLSACVFVFSRPSLTIVFPLMLFTLPLVCESFIMSSIVTISFTVLPPAVPPLPPAAFMRSLVFPFAVPVLGFLALSGWLFVAVAREVPGFVSFGFSVGGLLVVWFSFGFSFGFSFVFAADLLPFGLSSFDVSMVDPSVVSWARTEVGLVSFWVSAMLAASFLSSALLMTCRWPRV